MRIKFHTIVVSLLVPGMLLSAGLSMAANVDTFARVNLVQGVEATVGAANLEIEHSDDASDMRNFSVSGPANYYVEVQMFSLEPQSQWTDRVSSDGIKFDARHDALGNLNLDEPLGGYATEDPSDNSTHYVVTLTYE